jgi:hypothetical protein
MDYFFVKTAKWYESLSCVFHYGESQFRFSSGRKGFLDTAIPNWPNKKWISISKLTGAELIIDNVPVSKFARAAVGTLVFGALGTIAGLVSGATARPKAKIYVALQIDDLGIASFTTRCNDLGTAYRLLNTLAQMEREYYKEHPDELKIIESFEQQPVNIKSNELFSEEIMKLKNILDEGIIDQDEFKEMKAVLIAKSKE